MRVCPFSEQRSQHASDIPLLRAKGAFFSFIFASRPLFPARTTAASKKGKKKKEYHEHIVVSEVFPS